MKQETALGSKPDKKAIASAIQRYLDANGLARKDLDPRASVQVVDREAVSG